MKNPYFIFLGKSKTSLVGLLLVLSSILFGIMDAKAVDITLGTGVTSTTFSPINTIQAYSYTQMIYIGTDISAGGGVSGMTITKIRFYLRTAPSSPNNCNNWTIYLGNISTSITKFASASSWIAVGNMTQVYSGTFTYPGGGNWIEFTLSTSNPFVWTGGNLVVAVDENAAGSSSGGNAAFNSTAVTSANTVNYKSNPTDIDPASPPSGTLTGTRPNIQLVMINPCTAPNSVNLSGYTSPICSGTSPGTFTATATGGTGGAYTYLWYKNSVSTGITTQTYNPGTLTANTNFYCAVSTGTGCTTNSLTTTIEITSSVTTPTFSSGPTSARCQGAGTVFYFASALNTTGITYSLDVPSLSAGNSIDANTGWVTYVAGWSGTTVITASAAGCGGPKTATHTVTVAPTVGTPIFSPPFGTPSTRCEGAGALTYTATATSSTAISYSLDAASLLAGNSIVAGTGDVTYVGTWNGSSTITATAAGCNGPKTATHTVTTNETPTALTVTPSSAAMCSTDILELIASGGNVSNATNIILSQDFNSTSNDWTTINNSSGGPDPALAAWTLQGNNNNYEYPSGEFWHSNDGTQFYLSNSDIAAPDVTETILQSPVFSTENYNIVTLSFYHHLNYHALSAKVEYSTDGINWNFLRNYTATVGSKTGFVQDNIALPTGQSSLYVRFKYDDTYGYYWGIDNVVISGGQNIAPVTWTPAAGLYTDAAAQNAYVANTPTRTVYAHPSATTTYTATAGTPLGCTSTATSALTVTTLPVASFEYSGSPYCSNGSNPSPNYLGAGVAGTFSSTTGLVFTGTPGQINLLGSTAGTYTVTNTIAAYGGCPEVTETAPAITITALPTASISYVQSAFCNTETTPQSVTLIGSGAYTGGIYSADAALSLASNGDITPSTSTPGTYTVTYTTAAADGCSEVTATTQVTITTLPVATFEYSGSPYCSNGSNPSPNYLGGGVAGTFSSTTGLSFTSTPGQINLLGSIAGTYTVTNTISAYGGCPAIIETAPAITITALPTTSISYAQSAFCNTETAAQSVTLNGSGAYTGGTYSADAGLSLASNGDITPSTSTPGTYTVTYTTAAADGCAAVTATTQVTITEPPTAAISYTGSPWCSTATSQGVTLTGTAAYTGGTYTASPIGLTIGAFSGEINPGSSAAGTYTVTYTIAAAGGCASVPVTTSVTIIALPTASISYTQAAFCNTETAAQSVTLNGSGAYTGGTYSGDAGLSIDVAGAITPSASTVGPHTVTYTIAQGVCAEVTATTQVTITALPTAAISYTGSPWCKTATAQTVTLVGTTGGVYSSDAELAINAATGEITPGSSAAGTFTVTYTIAATGGCAAVSATTDVTVSGLPTATIATTSVSCYGGSNGAVDATIIGGTPPYSAELTKSIGCYPPCPYPYFCSDGNCIRIVYGTNPHFSDLPAGQYPITITDANGCSTTITATVNEPEPITPTITTTNITCNGANDGAIHGSIVGGTSPYSSQFVKVGGCIPPCVSPFECIGGFCITPTNPDPHPDLTGLKGGEYSLMVSDANGCSASVNTTITEPDALSATITITSVSCNGGSNGAVDATIIGGTPPYSAELTKSIGCYPPCTYPFFCRNGNCIRIIYGPNPHFSDLPAGIYPITITDANGCSYTTTATITEPPLPIVNISYSNSPWCTTSGVQTVTQTGIGGGSYTVSPPGLTIDANNGEITPGSSEANTYTVTYTIAAEGCAAVTATTDVTITAFPSAAISYAGTPFCITDGTSQSVTLVGTLGGAYSSDVDLAINAGSGAITPSASLAGLHTVTYTIAAANGCAEVTATTDVTVTELPTAAISYTGSPWCTTAISQTATLVGTTGGVYSSDVDLAINASTGEITPGSSVAGLHTVTYTIAAAGGCTAVTATTNVTITALPTAAISYAGTPFCITDGTSQSVTLVGTLGGAYSSDVDLAINAGSGAITPNLSLAGLHTVTYTIAAAGGCASVTATTDVTVTELPTAAISYTGLPWCTIATAQTVTLVGTTGGVYSSDVDLAINASTGEITPGSSVAGLHTVTYTIAAAGGCATVTATTDVTITALPVASFSYTGSPYLSNATNPLPSLDGVAGVFSSTAGLVFVSDATGEVDLAGSTPGTYTVTNTIAAAGGCDVVTATSDITINAFSKTLDITILVEGLYTGGVTMHEASDESYGPKWGVGIADVVTVELHSAADYSIVESSYTGNLLIDGHVIITTVAGVLSGDYYITVLHRNSVPVTTALPVSFAGISVSYDFTSGASQAYGIGAQKDLGSGIYGMYTGEVNHDAPFLIDGDDVVKMLTDIPPGLVGYYDTDLNGNGLVDGNDLVILLNNIPAGVYYHHP